MLVSYGNQDPAQLAACLHALETNKIKHMRASRLQLEGKALLCLVSLWLSICDSQLNAASRAMAPCLAIS